jgi:hypothetical protein
MASGRARASRDTRGIEPRAANSGRLAGRALSPLRRFVALPLKTARTGDRPRGFESHALRQFPCLLGSEDFPVRPLATASDRSKPRFAVWRGTRGARRISSLTAGQVRASARAGRDEEVGAARASSRRDLAAPDDLSLPKTDQASKRARTGSTVITVEACAIIFGALGLLGALGTGCGGEACQGDGALGGLA